MTGTGATIENLVIGGGLAGSMAAMRLAAAGREVLLLERERTGHHKVCGEFLSAEAVQYLREMGVDPLALGAAIILRMRLSSGNRIIEAALPFTAMSLSRSVLDEALIARAAEQGCRVLRGVSAERLEARDGMWRCDLDDSAWLRAQSVFLATGKHDLRGWHRGPGVQSDLVGFKMHWRLGDAQTEVLRDCMELFLFSGGYGGLSLVEGDVANVCLVVRQPRLRKLGGWHGLLTHLLSENAHMRERLALAQALWERPLAISSIPYGYLAGNSGDLWCVGDQAAVIPSFTGDGMSIALHSGSLAAEMYLAGERPEHYQRKLKSQLRRGMWVATTLSRLMVVSAAGDLAPAAMMVLPRLIGWIANATRVPGQAMHGFPAR